MNELITKTIVQNLLPKRNENSNKGDFGKVLNIVSSEKYFGAGVFAALASLRVGCGYSIFCSSDKVIDNYKISPSLIYKSHKNFNFDTVKNIITTESISSVVLGCGISTEKNVIEFTQNVIELLKNTNLPVVLDADGLNCLSVLDNVTLNDNFILTPHSKELSRLLSIPVDEIEKNREYYIKVACQKYNSTVVLKGHKTLVSTSDSVIYENTTGNSALSKSGTGDVLAGMIGGFLAQKTSPLNAGILSVYLHGFAADIYANEYSEYSMLSEELLNYIPYSIRALCH